MDDGDIALIASLDLAGAFDTIDREVLVRKLDNTCGIRGAAGDLLEDYLRKRYQRVRKRDEKGGWRENPWGVPQGSVLGPLLFVLFCADLTTSIEGVQIMQYADDVTLIVTAETAKEAVATMNQALAEFTRYATGNRLAVEPSKTQLMACANRRSTELKEVRCKMNGHEIEPTETVEILGVTLDDRLSWEVHNAKAAGKASGIARAVARGVRFLYKDDRAALIQALAHPHLEYCQTALAEPSAAALNSIRRAYNRTARMATGLKRSDPARKRLRWPEWEKRREAVSEVLTGRIWHRGEPRCLREVLPDGDRRKDGITRAAARGEIDIHGARLKVGRKAFRCWGPEAYNRTCRRVEKRAEPETERKGSDTGGKRGGKAPEDADATERKGYYAYLEEKYKGRKETRDEEGRIMIWT
eukprot:gene17912-biopygen33807